MMDEIMTFTVADLFCHMRKCWKWLQQEQKFYTLDQLS